MWDRLGSGQLLWVSEGRAALKVASIQLSRGCCTTASVSFDGGNRIVVGRWDSGQLRLARISLPSETSWGSWHVGGASEVPVTEWREGDHGARRDVVTVSLTSDAGSRAPHLLFKVCVLKSLLQGFFPTERREVERSLGAMGVRICCLASV